MIWRADVLPRPNHPDALGEAALAAFKDHEVRGVSRVEASRVYLLDVSGDGAAFEAAAETLLSDPVVEVCRVTPGSEPPETPKGARVLLIFKRPGVTDPVEASARKAFRDLGLRVEGVRTGIRYAVFGKAAADEIRAAVSRRLANEVVDEILTGDRPFEEISLGSNYEFRLLGYPLREAGDDELRKLSRELGLSLDLREISTSLARGRRYAGSSAPGD